MIGYLHVDFEKYKQWYLEYGFRSICGLWSLHVYDYSTCDLNSAYTKFSCDIIYDNDTSDVTLSRYKKEWDNEKSQYLIMLEEFCTYLNKFNQSFEIIANYDIFYHVKSGQSSFIFLKESEGISVDMLHDYQLEDVMSNQESALGGLSTELIPSGSTLKMFKDKMADIECEEEYVKNRAEAINSGAANELVALQAELDTLQAKLDAQKAKLLEQLQTIKDELSAKRAKVERDIEILETKIYAIRCFTGEIINFTKLRDGDRLPETVPLVVHQKIRYLDEEMGKLCALYDFDFSDINYFEEFISNNDEALDLFCPSLKCVSVVRISKDGKIYSRSGQFYNMLEAYETFHGTCLGILIRDGGTLYCGWTDEIKISIPDDIFCTASSYTDIVDESTCTESSSKSEILSRYFLLNILQGCLSPMSNSYKLINLPESADMLKPNDYVIYSSADGWIDSDKYESLSEMIEMCNSNTKVGDTVITVMYLATHEVDTYCNERGRGYANITRGCKIGNNSIKKINLIDNAGSRCEYKSGVILKEQVRKYSKELKDFITVEEDSEFNIRITFDNNTTKKDAVERVRKSCEQKGVKFDEQRLNFYMVYNYYVSVLKDGSDYTYYNGFNERRRESRVNFLIDTDEFINVECMNSNWLEYFITSKKIGNVRIGCKSVNYSYLIMYLNTAIKYVKQREEHEMSLLMDAGFKDFDKIDWLDRMSRYKLRTGRHEIKPRWAKQLAQELNAEVSKM